MMKSQEFHIKKNNQSGQSLFEVVFAVGMVSLVLITIVSLGTISIRNSTNAKTTNQATRAIEDGTEWIRGERDTDWDTFYNHMSTSLTYCLANLNWSRPSSCGSQEFVTGTIIQRSVTFTVVDTTTIQADVKSSWTNSQGTHVIVSSTYFTKWR